ncbi:hypothetical protein RUMCAL_02230 [Ruminococcus callidus ATCC 27760]|uniref:Uncharacterized protein n=1 Tax=Ruminococcus callidus ATCC 27760 TaxID=411473 RepID=U2KNS4_9FIRM|nr:hypothetical protein RUMCAL_02230 [Ruminococcus callidus ATCC 27760]
MKITHIGAVKGNADPVIWVRKIFGKEKYVKKESKKMRAAGRDTGMCSCGVGGHAADAL